jgi:hypothetical protein
MHYRRALAISTFALITVLMLPANGQSVISTHSGIVHFFEGAVYLGDQPLESHPGRFTTIPQGAELRTAEGRAEVLLTPGVFIRIGERSTIRMVATDLTDTRVELVAGSAIVDSAEPVAGTLVTLIYKNWSVRFLEQGIYRIDSDPPRMWVLDGKAEVSAGPSEKAVLVKEGMYLPFATVLVPDRSGLAPIDALSKWADGREQSISADNAIAANIQDPASMDVTVAGGGSFTYFPPLGLPPAGLGLSSLYGSQGLYQPGFNSIYLPGFAYLPLFFGLGPIGNPPVRPLVHSGGSPFPIVHIPIPRMIPTHPAYVPPSPIRPVMVQPTRPMAAPSMATHPGAMGGMHVGAHR